MKQMDCPECERMIPVFLGDGLSGSNILRFKEHIDHCSSCKEELAIQFLSQEGIAHLETGTSFHLEQELAAFMNRAVAGRRRKIKMRLAMVIYEVMALLVIFGIYFYAGN